MEGMSLYWSASPCAQRRWHLAFYIVLRLAEVLIVPTFQRSTLDLVKMGEVIEKEKDRLLEVVSCPAS